MLRISIACVCFWLPVAVAAEFIDIGLEYGEGEQVAMEVAQCSGYTEFMKQLAERASKPDHAKTYVLQTAALQALAALPYINDLGLSEKEAMSKVYEITGFSANKIAHDMLDDFANTQEEWTEQCETYLSEARELAESPGLLRLLELTE